jgi:MFS family permease
MPVHMGLYQTLYYMSLVGGMAGLFAWALAASICAALPNSPQNWVSDLVAATILGGFIGGLTAVFSDRWSGNRVLPRWIVSGILVGIVAGAAAGAIQIPITAHLAPQAPGMTRLIAWMLVGACIGLGIGLRWIQVNRARVVHAAAGGLIGGALGGFIFGVAGRGIPDLPQALGFMTIGVCICFGVTLAPILLRDGLLQFVSSGDPRAQMKFGRSKKEWEVLQGNYYVVGSQSQELTKTRFRADTGIFIPDAAVAPHHAALFAKDGRFYVARHPETGGQAGLARYVLRVRGKTITASQELQNNDDILIGRTALRFVAKKKEG